MEACILSDASTKGIMKIGLFGTSFLEAFTRGGGGVTYSGLYIGL